MEKISALYSRYVIDGIPQDLTPGQMLDDCLVRPVKAQAPEASALITDETSDPTSHLITLDSWKIRDYLSSILEAAPAGQKTRGIDPVFAPQYTKIAILEALEEMLWRKGSFKLGDLLLSMGWKWDMESIGGAAAFFASAQSAAEYLSGLSLRLDSYDFKESAEDSVTIEALIEPRDEGDDDFPVEMPFTSQDPKLEEGRAVPEGLVPDPESWIVYIPTESCEYRLGGSLLASLTSQKGGIAPDSCDPDYFIDCFEVVREMVEDGVIIAGASVGRGGLMTALKRMSLASEAKTGASVSLTELMAAAGENDAVRVLFAEAPGIIMQIKDEDFDYIDAELTLQDVAFYPLGHPVPGSESIKTDSSDKPHLQTILESLIQSRSSEGED